MERQQPLFVSYDGHLPVPVARLQFKTPQELLLTNHLLLAFFRFTALELFRRHHFDTNGSNPLQKRPDGLSK